MNRILVVVLLAVIFLAGSSGGWRQQAAGRETASASKGVPALGPADSTERNLHFECSDGRGFSLKVRGKHEDTAILTDGTNGLAFNLRAGLFTAHYLYADSHILAGMLAQSAFVIVDGDAYFSSCLLRTHSYSCAGGKTFSIDIMGADQGSAVFTDGANRKVFTIYNEPVSNGTRYSDRTLTVDLGWADASVFVEGRTYLNDCNLVQ